MFTFKHFFLLNFHCLTYSGSESSKSSKSSESSKSSASVGQFLSYLRGAGKEETCEEEEM